MNRDQRVADNWSFLHAAEIAIEMKQPLGGIFITGFSPLKIIRQRIDRKQKFR